MYVKLNLTGVSYLELEKVYDMHQISEERNHAAFYDQIEHVNSPRVAHKAHDCFQVSVMPLTEKALLAQLNQGADAAALVGNNSDSRRHPGPVHFAA